MSLSYSLFYFALSFCLFCFVLFHSGVTFAESYGFDSSSSASSEVLSGKSFPWTKMLNKLAKELTGPLPMILGMLGIAAAAIAMFTGNGGGGTQKFIMLIFAVSTCLFAPTFITWIRDSAGSATLSDVLVTGEAVKEGIRSGALLP